MTSMRGEAGASSTPLKKKSKKKKNLCPLHVSPSKEEQRQQKGSETPKWNRKKKQKRFLYCPEAPIEEFPW